MCGVLGVFGLGGSVDLDDRAVVRLRDTLVHRGPDDAGVWRCPWAVLAHRRLSVIAPGPEGHQPMVTPDGRYALVYNGELYNDAQVRRDLAAEGVVFRTACDTETVLWAMERWGERAIDRLRGMFAIGFVDTVERRVILARDPLGVKPLYAARLRTADGTQVIFASEPPAILAHPDMATEPDWVTVSGYLTTIRPTLGRRTMFAGLETLLPGETRVYDARADRAHRVIDAWAGPESSVGDAGETGAVIADAVASHLRTDVPMCALLSGGLDSSAVVLLAKAGVGHRLRTYCAGALPGGPDDDFSHARAMAAALDTDHTEVGVGAASFVEGWREIISRTGVPVSTPNEVAILAVARSLRAGGNVVTLSGEGADELFGGYGPPMMQAAARVELLGGRPDDEGGLFHLMSNAWVSPGIKTALLQPDTLGRIEGDGVLADAYQSAFAEASAHAPGDSPLQAHLRFHRRMNLPNLLRRLDSCTMLASVEGRTPFADIRVARFAESLAMADKFVGGEPPRTKAALRDSFRGRLPESVVARPKASFPLPFEGWMSPMADELGRSDFARAVFTPAAIERVLADPAAAWTHTWPMVNIAAWGERWWGTSFAEPVRTHAATV